MDRAKLERSVARRRFSLCAQRLQTLLKGSTDKGSTDKASHDDRTNIYSNFEILSTLYDDLLAIQRKVTGFWLNDVNRNEKLFQHDLVLDDEYTCQWHSLKQRVKEAVDVSESEESQLSTDAVKSSDGVKNVDIGGNPALPATEHGFNAWELVETHFESESESEEKVSLYYNAAQTSKVDSTVVVEAEEPSQDSSLTSSGALKRKSSHICPPPKRPNPDVSKHIPRDVPDSGSEVDADEENDADDHRLIRQLRKAARRLKAFQDSDQEPKLPTEGKDSEVAPTNGQIEQANPDENKYYFTWTNRFATFRGHVEQNSQFPGPIRYSNDAAELFQFIWDRNIVEKIVYQTNKYAREKFYQVAQIEGGMFHNIVTWTETSVHEMYCFLAILIYMSLSNRRGGVDEYWTTGVFGMPEFQSLLSRKRFSLLLHFLHFVDNDSISAEVRSFDRKIEKISPLLEHCNIKFRELYVPQRHLNVDESLLLWNGRLSWVKLKDKSHKLGLKSFDLCEAKTGYLLKTLLYSGKDSPQFQDDVNGFKNDTAKIVLKLLDGFLDLGHTVVMNDCFNQLSLARYLKSRRTDVLGMLDRKRENVPTDIKDLDHRLMKKGDMVSRHCRDIAIVAWKDDELVTTMSTCYSDAKVKQTRRGESFWKPLMFQQYTKFAHGVERKNQILSDFRDINKTGKKWYIKMFERLINATLLNTFLVYRTNPEFRMMSQREFRFAVCEGLASSFGNRDVCKPLKSSEIRFDRSLNHFPVTCKLKNGRQVGSRKRTYLRRLCLRCSALGIKRHVYVMCGDCNVGLCAGTCWLEYHTVVDLKSLSSPD